MATHRAPSPVRRPAQSTLLRTARAGVAMALLASGIVACATTTMLPAPRTARVERTSVTTGVTSTGSLTAATEENLGFPTGGQLTEVDVKVGDHVQPGQVLAVIDPFAARQMLLAAQAQLGAQVAGLNRITASTSIGGANASLGQARDLVGATGDQADAVLSADGVAIDNANNQLSVDKKAQSQAQDQLDSDQDACPSGSSATSRTRTRTSGSTITTAVPSAGSSMSGSSMSGSVMSGSSMPGSMTGASATAVPPTITTVDTGSTTNTTTRTTPDAAACARIPSDKSAVIGAKKVVTADKSAIAAAQQKKDVDSETGKLSVTNAQTGVVSAQNAVNSATADRPGSIAQQSAAVNAAAANVATAQKNLANTTLRAPVGGVVSALNGAVGEFVAPSSGLSALAPGSDAAIPGTGGTSGSAAAAGAASPTRPGGTQFLVLDDLDKYQVVLAFSETDASLIAAGQAVKLTFDAVPDLTLDGSVLSVSPTGTAISGVISYYVTVAVTQNDPRLKVGMTAEAEIVTKNTSGVLAVPSSAVHGGRGNSTVTVVEPDGTQRAIIVTPGAIGDGLTQVLNGVQEGQQIVLPATP